MVSTTELAKQLGIKPESLRTSVARAGSYFGVVPIGRLPNGRLAWPDDAAARLIASATGGPCVDNFHKGPIDVEIRVGSDPETH